VLVSTGWAKRASMLRSGFQAGTKMVYDTIIVGGGSAGSVLANRLSARSASEILLCEAGQDTPSGKVPPEIPDSYPGVAYFDRGSTGLN
jgi:choline dehydrogenase-like flavoprotein